MVLMLRATVAHSTLHFADSEISSLAAVGIGPQENVFKSDLLLLHFFTTWCPPSFSEPGGNEYQAQKKPSKKFDMSEEIDRHVLRKYEIMQKLGKGACTSLARTRLASSLLG